MLNIFKRRKDSGTEPEETAIPEPAEFENAVPADAGAGSESQPGPAADGTPSLPDCGEAAAQESPEENAAPGTSSPMAEDAYAMTAPLPTTEGSSAADPGDRTDSAGPCEIEGSADGDAPGLAAPADGEEESIPSEESLAMPEAPVITIPAGPAARIFDAFSCAAPVALLVLAAAVTGITAWLSSGLGFSDAGRIADAVMSISPENWLTITADGTPCPDIPPLFVWAAAALAMIPGLPAAAAPVAASAAAYCAFIVSVWAFAASVGFGRRMAFASGLAALCCIPVTIFFSILGPELLYASLCTAGMACLYRGWTRTSAPFLLGSGFALLGLSAMAGGPFGIAAAIAASVVFLFWRGTPGRLNGRDGIPGFLLMLLMIAAWFSALYLNGNEDYLRAMLGGVLLPRIVGPEALAAEWHSSLAVLPALIMPWTLLPLFADWPAAFRGIPSAWRNRRSDGGASWLWIWLTCAAAILSCLPSIRLPMLLPAAAPLAVLAGRSVMRLSYARSRCFFGTAAALYALAGLALVLAETYLPLRAVIPADIMALIPDGTLPELPAEAAALLPMLSGIMYSGALLILLAVALLFFCRTPIPGGALLLTAFILSAAAAPWQYLTVPAISAAASSAAPEAAPSPSLLPAPGTADGPVPSAIPGPPADDPARPESDESPRPDASAAPEAPAATL